MKRIGISHRGRSRGSLLLWILLFTLTAATLSCSGNNDNPPQSRSWYYEHEFAQNPQLLANPDHVIIFDIAPSDGLTEVEHSIPYRFEKEESWLFAVEPNDPHITRLELLDRVGGVVAVTEPGQGGMYLSVSPGKYTLKVLHDGSQVSAAGTVAFARTQVSGTGQSARMEAGAGEGSAHVPWKYPAYVALQIVGGDYDGQYLATYETNVHEDLKTVPVSVLKAVSPAAPGSEFSDRAHLFSLTSKTNNLCDDSTEDNYVLHSWTADAVGDGFTSISYACTWSIDCPGSQNHYPISQWTEMPGFHPHSEEWSTHAQDAGDGAFSLLMSPFLYGQDCSFPYVAENGYVYLTGFSDGEASGKFKVDSRFRIYKDGSDIDINALETGEVALYEGADHSGVAVVLNESFTDMTLIPLDQVGSVAFGIYTNTTVELFDNSGASLKVVGTNATDLNITDIGSIEIFDSKQILVSSKRCPYCNLAGVDLSDLDLDGADLAYANLAGANLHFSSLVGAKLSFAILQGANLINTNFEGATLLNAFLNGDSTLKLAAASLTGAHLKNVNLAGANLGGVEFTNANFYTTSYLYSGCAQDADTDYTKNCASAEGANLSGATFFGAYLAGADFSSSTAKSTVFTNAVLVGANFVGANLDWSSQTSGRTNFTGAFIGGANFGGKTTVENATFDNAYVDSATGATMLFILSSEHTQFPGYRNSGCLPGARLDCHTPCVFFSYAKPTAVPNVTDTSNICVDANSGPCGSNTDPGWTDIAIPRDKSSQANSKFTDVPPLCTIDEINTNWSNASNNSWKGANH